MAMVNDGTKSYDHNTDGASQQLGSCIRNFRNKPFPVKAKIEYFQKTLTYKLSFKGPHLVVLDGTIPFWDHGGHAIASEESIRITPSLRSKKGYVWSKQKKTFENWEAEVTFRVSGRGRIGADGLAIWYTENRMTEGPVFGNQDNWKGLGLFFDSFDNDNQHNNPIIMAMVNDGTKSYDHNTDGASQQLGSCIRDFRNKPFPVKAKIEYFQKTLTVMLHNGMTNNKDDFELCLRVENVVLPSEGYFGISAATGGLAAVGIPDDHDVFSFITHQLIPAGSTQQQQSTELSPNEKKKYEEEFDEYSQKLQKAKEEYKKEHPDMKQPESMEEDKFFESPDIQELKMIFEGQNMIHTSIRSIHQRIDEIVGRQERTLSQLTLMSQQTQTSGHQASGSASPHGQVQTSPIQRHEVDTLLTSLRDLTQLSRDIKYLVDGFSSKLSGSEQAQQPNDVRVPLANIQNDIRMLLARPAPERQAPCPQLENSCTTSFTLFIFLLLQSIVFLAYSLYRSSREAAAKKFY